ncbi:MAG: hypothetical protein ACREOH_23360, partial [Candidatus Entotheonellia bacterium]
RRIVLALDPDEAGGRATLRGLDLAGAAMDREADPVFDPRGLVRHEGRLKADIRVLTMPEGLDPDEYLIQQRESWPGLVAGALPVVEHVISVLTRGRDLADPRVKSEIIQRVMPLIEDVAEMAQRDTYRQKLARILRVDERHLMGKRVSRTLRHAKWSAADVVMLEKKARRSEAYCLGALVRDPALLYKADRALSELGLARLTPEDFSHTEHQLIFRGVQAALEQVDVDPAEHAREMLDESLRERLESVLAAAEDVKLSQPRAVADIVAAVLRLRQRNIHDWLGELRSLVQEAQEQGDGRAEMYFEEIQKQAGALAGLDRALGRHIRHIEPVAA